MKKLLLLLVTTSIFLVGCKSKEEKAQEAIKKEMFKTLYDFNSYEPIETKVDSSFYSIYTDTAVLKHGYMIAATLKSANESLEKVKDAKSTMDIWGDLYTSYSVAKYNEAKEDFNKYMNEAELYLEMIKAESDTIKSLSKNNNKSFNGWKVTHKFRCKTKGGNSTIGNYIYIFDKDMKSIIYQEDIEDEDLKKVKDLIKEAIEKKDDDPDRASE